MIRLDRLTKIFETPRGAITASDNISLEVPEGEICVLLGPSGCGKTTTMKMINRLITPTSGKIFINGKDTDEVDPILLRRSIGYVIQQIGLFPNKTVVDNICTVPDLLGWDRKKSRARAAELLEMVALDPNIFLRRYPRELSGGQQQRIGVVRALAADPPVMLMDEPFGAIDPINREIIQDEFLSIQRKLGKTVMFVSHDLDEAIKMADKIAIFRDGKLEQFASPSELLAHPENAFVEEFLGADRALKRLRLNSVRDAMISDFPSIGRTDSMESARILMPPGQDSLLFVVGPRGRPRGMLTRDTLHSASDGLVEDHMVEIPETVRADTDLHVAVATMLAHGMDCLACVDADGLMCGLLNYKSVTRRLQHVVGD